MSIRYWIDAATAADPALTPDAFWQQSTPRQEQRLQAIQRILASWPNGLTSPPTNPSLTGKLVISRITEAFILAQGPILSVSNLSVDVSDAANPFSFIVKIGEVMHRQLLRFSEFYLGIFVVLQVGIIIVAFLRLRGPRRVWLWFFIPCFALVYTVAGVLLAHMVIWSRSEVRFAQVVFQRDTWPQGLLLTHA